MHYRAKITSKGQITIPAEVRRSLGLEVGNWVAFETQADYATVRRAKTLREVSEEIRAKTVGHTRIGEAEDDAVAAAVSQHLANKDQGEELLVVQVPKDFVG